MTTTGATVFEGPGRITEPVHIWRAMVGWLGGFLTLVTAIALLAPMNLAGFEVLRPIAATDDAERAIAASDPNTRMVRFSARIFPLYLGATLALWFILSVLGMEPYPACLLYTSPSPRDQRGSRMPSSA